jgi:hypothetical protein
MRLLPWSIWQASAAVVVEDEMKTSTARKDRIVGRARTIPSSSSHEQRRRHLIHDSIALSLRDWKLSACCCFRIICLSAASFIVLSSFLPPSHGHFFLGLRIFGFCCQELADVDLVRYSVPLNASLSSSEVIDESRTEPRASIIQEIDFDIQISTDSSQRHPVIIATRRDYMKHTSAVRRFLFYILSTL